MVAGLKECFALWADWAKENKKRRKVDEYMDAVRVRGIVSLFLRGEKVK